MKISGILPVVYLDSESIVRCRLIRLSFMKIEKSITIEELVEKVPEAILYLSKNGIRCVLCGEPIWGTLEEAAKQKGFSDADIARFVEDINKLAEGEK